MGSVATLKEELSQTLDFFNELAPQMIKAKDLVSRWSIHNEFKYQCNTYNNRFETDDLVKEMNNVCWEQAINELNFLSLEQRKVKIEEVSKSTASFLSGYDSFLEELEKNKYGLIEETINSIYGKLTKYRLSKGNIRKEKEENEIQEKTRFLHFCQLEDGFLSWREQERAEWFNDLEMVARFLNDRDPLNGNERFGEKLKESLEKALKKEGFSCQVSCEYFSVRVFKNGNVELKFKESSQDILNWCFASCKKVSLKQFLLIKNLKDFSHSDSNNYASSFKLKRLDDDKNPIMFFEIWSKIDKQRHDGHLKILNNLVEVEIYNGDGELINSNKILERNTNSGLYSGLIDYFKEIGKGLDDSILEKNKLAEAVEFEKEEIKRKLELINGQYKGGKTLELAGKLSSYFEKSSYKMSILSQDKEALRIEIRHERDSQFLVEASLSNVIHIKTNYGGIFRLPIGGDDAEQTYKVFHSLWESILMAWGQIDGDLSAEIVSNNFDGLVQNEDSNVIYLHHSVEPSGEISIEVKDDGSIFVTGDTKQFKEDLKKFKLAWSRKLKVWYVPGSRKRDFCEQTKKHLHDLRRLLESKGVIVTSYVANM